MPAVHQPRAAARSFLKALGSVTDCVTPQRLFVHPMGYEPDVRYTIAFGPTADPVALTAKSGGSGGILLDIRYAYAIVSEIGSERTPRLSVVTQAYEYRVLDSLERELLTYHWQPTSDALGPDFPHLHVSATLTVPGSRPSPTQVPLDKRHLPTGIVSVAMVIRLLIAEFGIAYRHRDWASRLNRAEAELDGLANRNR